MLWKKAIPAEQRMREIEDGIEREVVETVQGLDEIRELQKQLLEGSNKGNTTNTWSCNRIQRGNAKRNSGIG